VGIKKKKKKKTAHRIALRPWPYTLIGFLAAVFAAVFAIVAPAARPPFSLRFQRRLDQRPSSIRRSSAARFSLSLNLQSGPAQQCGERERKREKERRCSSVRGKSSRSLSRRRFGRRPPSEPHRQPQPTNPAQSNPTQHQRPPAD